MFGVQFYPTPLLLVERMMKKVDWSKVQFALEPSAGKGDLANGIRNRMKQEKKPCQLDCVEIDPDLRAVLRERGFHVAANDFLTWDAQTRYDLTTGKVSVRIADLTTRILRVCVSIRMIGGNGKVVKSDEI